jgi:hypothetical protein
MTHAFMRTRILASGSPDLQDAHFGVFSYPLPDGVRPSELARNMRMSRQAANYLIVQLEELDISNVALPRAAINGGYT